MAPTKNFWMVAGMWNLADETRLISDLTVQQMADLKVQQIVY